MRVDMTVYVYVIVVCVCGSESPTGKYYVMNENFRVSFYRAKRVGYETDKFRWNEFH